MNKQMQTIDLVYEEFGQVNECPIVILHGFLASSRNWRTVAKTLAENHYVLVLDQRNHGDSPHAEHMDYPSMAEDLAKLMDRLGLERAHLLGHSMGGKVAMWFALHYPFRVDRLIIADIAPVNYDHSFDNMIQALKLLPLTQITNRKEAEKILSDAIPDLSFRQFLLQNLLLKNGAYTWRINLDYIGNTARHIVGFPELKSQRYAREALFITGERSTYVRPDKVLNLFPDAQIVEIPETGHWLYVEAPDRFCQIVDDWISCRN